VEWAAKLNVTTFLEERLPVFSTESATMPDTSRFAIHEDSICCSARTGLREMRSPGRPPGTRVDPRETGDVSVYCPLCYTQKGNRSTKYEDATFLIMLVVLSSWVENIDVCPDDRGTLKQPSAQCGS
jgi:hypothetical protein